MWFEVQPAHLLSQRAVALIVGCGCSGTGKGTTVQRLSEQLPNTVTWSNGNIFRSVTLLAATWSEQNEKPLSEALTADNLKTFMGMLSFGQFDGVWTTRINGLGVDALISDIQNTVLKGPKVSEPVSSCPKTELSVVICQVGANIPTVAQEIQGEVVAFASGAIEQMSNGGLNVLLEVHRCVCQSVLSDRVVVFRDANRPSIMSQVSFGSR